MTLTPPQDSAYHEDTTPETCLRIVDQTVTDWLKTLRFRSQNPTVVTVWQSRQFAQQHEINHDKPVKQAFPLPIVTVAMSSIAPDLSRRIVGDVYRAGYDRVATVYSEAVDTGDAATSQYTGFLGYADIVPGSVTLTAGALVVTDDGDGTLVGDTDGSPANVIDYDTGHYTVTFSGLVGNGTPITAAYQATSNRMFANSERTEVYVLPFPLPFNLTYQIDIYTKTQQDMQMLRTDLLSRFVYTDETYLKATFGGYGEKLIPIRLSRIDDTTTLEPSEKDKELRNTITLTAQAWIFRCPVAKKVIRSANIAFIDAGTDPANLLDGSAFMDWYCDLEHYTFSDTVPAVLQAVDESPDFTPPNRAIAFYAWVDGTLTEVGP